VTDRPDIVKPDYWQTGVPKPSKSLLPWMIEVKAEEEIAKMRAAGRLARHVLDVGGRAVRPGVTTDEIDALVHEEIIKVSSSVAGLVGCVRVCERRLCALVW